MATTPATRRLRQEAARSRAQAEIHWTIAEQIADMSMAWFLSEDEHADLRLDIYEAEAAKQYALHAEFTADAEDRIAQAEIIESS